MLAGMGREGVASTRDVRAEGVKLEAPVTRLAWQAVVTLSSGAGLRCGPGEAFGRLPVQVGAGTWVCISERSGGSDLVETGSKASVRPTDPVESRAAVLPLLSDDYLDAGARPSLRDSVAVSEADLAPTPASETLSNSVGAPAPDWLPLVLLAGFAALAPALYRRLTSEGVRAQAVRAGLLAAVRARPGRTLSDLARETGLHVSTVGYHSRMLSDAGAVVLHRDGRAVRVFENGGRYGPADRARWSVGNRAGVARLVAILPPAGARAGDVARVLGITPRAIRKRLPTLEQAGLVRVERLPSGLSILPGAWATRAP